jgi:hypothetical protein
MQLRRLWIAGLLLSCVLVSRVQADECVQGDPRMLEPDLVSLAPKDIRVLRHAGVRQIIFTSSIANVGAGPFIVHGHTVDTPDGQKTEAIEEIWLSDGTSCTHDIGFFEYHPEHHHFHLDDVSSYQLRQDDPITGPIVAQSAKISFCLLDVMPLPGFQAAPQFVNNCEDPEGTYGISVGYADVYESILPGQSIDITDVPDGDYFLVNSVNPDQNIWEENDSRADNAGFVSVHIRANAVSVQPVPRMSPPTPPPTPPATLTPPPTPTPTPEDAPSPTPTLSRGPHQPHQPHTTVIFPRPRVPHAPHGPHSPVH